MLGRIWAAAVMLPGMAFAAGPLDQTAIDQFITATENMQEGPNARRLDHIDFAEIVDPIDFGKTLDKYGEVVVLQRLIWRLQRQDEEALSVIDHEAKKAGFRDAREFAKTGDRVLTVGAAAKTEEIGLEPLVSAAMAVSQETLEGLPRKQRILLGRVQAFDEVRRTLPAREAALIDSNWSKLQTIEID
ncbi:hypothetical protein [Parvularcula lutaonensis]|uniref:Uncharacterized protein n=1 Tax=Parvularcula lutaonensis TaxID=491923 RepID=A0ABV7MDE0_9PROT|nr:hypothetical protein [Parvularcula lutaonensis]